jgi:signal transduction histidine kinase
MISIKQNLSNTILKGIVFIYLFFEFVPVTLAQVTPDEIKATLIVHFCENVSWPSSLKNPILIGCFTDDGDEVFGILKNASQKIKIQDNKFEVIKIQNLNEINQCQAIYFKKEDMHELVDVFKTSRENGILLITDNYSDQLFIMINMVDDKDKISFKVNVPNLTLAGFTIHTNLLLNGGSVVDIKAAYQKFENQLKENQQKLEETKLALEQNEQLIRMRDSLIRIKEVEINELFGKISQYQNQSDELIQNVAAEKAKLNEKLNELRQKDIQLKQIYTDIEKKQNELQTLKDEVVKLVEQSTDLKSQINEKQTAIEKQNQFIDNQKKIIILSLSFIIALIIAAFALSSLFLTKRRLSKELEEKVKKRTHELNQQNQLYLSLINLTPVAIWEMDLSETKKYIDSLNVNLDTDYEMLVKKYKNFDLECVKRMKLVHVNKASLDLYGLKTADEIIPLYQRIHDQGNLQGLVKEFYLILKDDHLHSYEAVRYNAQNERLDVLINGLNISDKKQSYSRVLLTMVDITRLRKVELELLKYQEHLEHLVKERTEELAASNEELESANEEYRAINEELILKNQLINDKNDELNRALKKLKEAQMQLVQSEKMASLGILTAGVAHEINNPLNFILGSYTGLIDYFEEKKIKQDDTITFLLKGIKTGVDLASSIVKSLNQFNRTRDSFDEVCHIHAIIDNCLVMLNNKIKKRIKVEKFYDQADVSIIGNVGKMHQVFINILFNSVQAIKEEGIIKISTRLNNKEAHIEIADTGCGISKENLPKIIDPFFTTKDPGQGTGLGLSIVYSIIQEHKGSIVFESEINQGTVVKINIPVA